jgi:adenylyltransferase/sulfurtransferase
MLFEDTRYNRQELMTQIGLAGQARLAAGFVVAVGAGGVKSSLLYQLTAVGVGRLRIIDFDDVELSNLNRQILFDVDDIGSNKAAAAARRLRRLNPDIDIEVVQDRLDDSNIAELCEGCDVLVEGGDSVEARLRVNNHALATGVPMVHASAQHGYGYVLTVLPGRTACFCCVFPDLPQGHGGSVPVFGVSTGLAGSLGAAEVVKLLLRTGRLTTDGILTFSVFQNEFLFVPSPRRADCPACSRVSPDPAPPLAAVATSGAN